MSISNLLGKLDAYILNPLIILAFAVSTVYFFYGIVKFLSSGMEGVDKARDEAKSAILWGMVGMIVMFSVFGLIRFVLDTFGVTPATSAQSYINYSQ